MRSKPESARLEETRAELERMMGRLNKMREGSLYECISTIKIQGVLHDGTPVTSKITPGMCVVAVRTHDGREGILVEGVVITYSWSTFGWGRQLREVFVD